MPGRFGAGCVAFAFLPLGQGMAMPPPTAHPKQVVHDRSTVLRSGLGLATLLSPKRASADAPVGEGGLPDGVRQFDRFLKVQGEWTRLGKRLAGSDPIDAKEWDALGLFLRKLYDEGDDMLVIARNLDADKKTAAKDIAAKFRATVKSADMPVRNQDRSAVTAAQKESADLMQSFLQLLQDVPDEL